MGGILICLQGSAEGRREGLGAQLESGAGMRVADSGDLVRKTSEGPAGTVSLGQDPQALKVTPHVDLASRKLVTLRLLLLTLGQPSTHPSPLQSRLLPGNFGMCESWEESRTNTPWE